MFFHIFLRSRRSRGIEIDEKKKKESAQEYAITIENKQRLKKREEPHWVSTTNGDKARCYSGSLYRAAPIAAIINDYLRMANSIGGTGLLNCS